MKTRQSFRTQLVMLGGACMHSHEHNGLKISVTNFIVEHS